MKRPAPSTIRAALLERLVIELPMPPAILSPNGPTWGRRTQILKSSARKQQRAMAMGLAKEAIGRAVPPRWVKSRITAAFWPASWAGLGADPMNRIASLKAAVDGLEDAGVFLNDRGVQWGEVTHPGIDAITPHVVLTIEPTAPAGGGGEVKTKIAGADDGN